MINKKPWLVYITIQNEMGSEGWSSWAYHCIAFGDTEEEIYNNWVENVKKIYDVDLSEDLCCVNGNWHCYYHNIYKAELPTSVYGKSQQLLVKAQYKKHTY